MQEEDEKKEGHEDGNRERSGSWPGRENILTSLVEHMKLEDEGNKEEKEEKRGNEDVLESIDLSGIAKGVLDGKFEKVIVMGGAGMSVAAGIPDFRSPGTGLYHNTHKYGELPTPEAIFELDYFKSNPFPFFELAREWFCTGKYLPTLSHFFVRLLHEKGLLLRHYTQNIDNLDREAGIPPEKLVEAHGSFSSASCTKCNAPYDIDLVRQSIMCSPIKPPLCVARKGEFGDACDGFIKPDITFFGEGLPDRFHKLSSIDFQECDALFVFGTSLQVQPFASLVSKVRPHVPRLLINNEEVGKKREPAPEDIANMELLKKLFGETGIDLNSMLNLGEFEFGMEGNSRDVSHIRDLEEGIKDFAELLGWKQELISLKEKSDAKHDPPTELPKTMTPKSGIGRFFSLKKK